MADNWLKEYRFTAIELPRRDLAPADVVFRSNGGFDQKVGNLPMLFSSTPGLPATTSGEPTGSIARSFEKKVEASLGVKILGALFGGGASSKLGVGLEAKHARSLSVTYEDVTQDSLAVLELQSWLEQAEIRTSRQATDWLNHEKLATVTAVLRTAKLSIVAEGENGVAIDLSVPEIQGIVAGEAKVSAQSSDSSKITFTGKEPIAFGFQAYVMIFDKNVSFGLEQTRGLEEQDFGAQAWTGEAELETVDDRRLPAD
jgi:hypothetical protein